MAKVAQITKTGGPEVIEWVDRDIGEPAKGEVRIRSTAVGLNYIDVYHRDGTYPVDLPSGLGTESVGMIEAVGDGVDDWKIGDRVGTSGPELGAYATERLLKADRLMAIPDAVSGRDAAALLLKGGTAEYLIERCARTKAGDTVLVHAAAGGVGHLLVGWLKAIGARVIGTVGSEEKAKQARATGADLVILHKTEDVVAKVKDFTGGAGVATVFDGVGGATWEQSLECCARRGLVITFGNAGGLVTGVNLQVLTKHGSLFTTRPTMGDYYRTPDERRKGIARVFEMLKEGAIDAGVQQEFALEDVAEAHRKLEASETTGATVLIP